MSDPPRRTGRVPGHTPEPWTADIPYIHAGDDDTNIAEVYGERMADLTWANARRIVACVNACAGMTDQQLDFPVGFLKRTQQMAQDGTDEQDAQLAELRALLERIRQWDHLDGYADGSGDGPYWRREIEEALARAREGSEA
jgi:hypothetical protein